MNWLIFLFLLLLFAPYGPQLRTHYAPRPALMQTAQRWTYIGPRRMVQITYVRLA